MITTSLKGSTIPRRCKAGFILVPPVALLLWALVPVSAMPAELVASPAPLRVEITVKARQFEPSPVILPAGREVILVFTNRDAELHAFVPIRFLEHVPLHVEGNGAPQFGEKGLVRVLIPSGGQAEIQFVPQATGVYQYLCDLPGHQMLGEIVVNEAGLHKEPKGEGEKK